MDEVTLRLENAASFKARTMAMARRLDGGDRAVEKASVSFETMDALLKILTPARWALLRTLRRNGPSSIRALAGLLERDYRNVHGDVAVLLETGLIERDEAGRIGVPWSKISAEMDIEQAA